jgi:hypothetical protein
MFEGCRCWEYEFIHDGWIIKRKGTGKDPVADDPVRMSRIGDREHRGTEQPSLGRTHLSTLHEHKDLMPDLSKASAWPRGGPMRDGLAQRHGSWWTIKDGGSAARESDQLLRHYTKARKANRSTMDNVRERTSHGMQRAALIMQVERPVVVIGVRI